MPSTDSPVLLLAGSDSFRLTTRASALVDSWLPPAERDFALTRISAKTAETSALMTAIDTPALFGDLRVIVIEDVEDMSAATRDAILPLLAATTSRGDDSVRILLLHRSDKAIDKRLAECASVERFEAMRRADAIPWLERETRTRNIPMASGSAAALVDAIGTDSGRLIQEAVKLSGMAQGPVTPAHVAQATTASPPDTPYALYDAIGSRHVGVAQKTLSSLLHNVDYPGVRILIGMTRHMAQIGVARARLDAGESSAAVAQSFGYPGRGLVQAAGQWTLSQIDMALDIFLDADRGLKTGRPDDLTLMTAIAAALS